MYSTLRSRMLYQMKTNANKAPQCCLLNKFGHGMALKDDTAVVADNFGKHILPHSFGTWWRRNRKDFGLEGWNIHELRHTFLTMAAQQGIHLSIM